MNDERMLPAHFDDPGLGRPFVIGLTGTIAAGKSTVAAMLRERGATVIDGDDVYRDLLAPSSPLIAKIAARFGLEVLTNDGSLNRPLLAQRVFNDQKALSELDTITHPPVVAEIRSRLREVRSPVVVVEAVKLGYTDLVDDIDVLWLVDADPVVREERLVRLRGIDRAAARSRIAAFPSSLPTERTADVVIDNSGDLDTTERQVAAAWHDLIVPAVRNRKELVAEGPREKA